MVPAALVEPCGACRPRGTLWCLPVRLLCVLLHSEIMEAQNAAMVNELQNSRAQILQLNAQILQLNAQILQLQTRLAYYNIECPEDKCAEDAEDERDPGMLFILGEAAEIHAAVGLAGAITPLIHQGANPAASVNILYDFRLTNSWIGLSLISALLRDLTYISLFSHVNILIS